MVLRRRERKGKGWSRRERGRGEKRGMREWE